MSRVPVPFGVQKRQRHPSRFFAGCCALKGKTLPGKEPSVEPTAVRAP